MAGRRIVKDVPMLTMRPVNATAVHHTEQQKRSQETLVPLRVRRTAGTPEEFYRECRSTVHARLAPYHFVLSASCRIVLSNVRSATNPFSSRFSSLSWRSSRSSLTLRVPKRFFQR